MKKLGSLLRKAESLAAGDVKKALAPLPETTKSIFAAAAVPSGPFSLVALVVSGKSVLKKPLASVKGVVQVDISNFLDHNESAIEWAIFPATVFQEAGAFLHDGAKVVKLGAKKNLEKGKLWVGSRTL